jgi:hypothetical protein
MAPESFLCGVEEKEAEDRYRDSDYYRQWRGARRTLENTHRREGEDEGEPPGEERQHGAMVCRGIAVDGERSVVRVDH